MLQNRTYPAGAHFFTQPEEDADIKIFGGSVATGLKPAEDDGAAEFVRERDNGNIERAQQMGRQMARKLGHLWRLGDNAVLRSQKKVLFAYAAAKVIEKHCANSVLSHAALSEFHHAVQLRSQKEYEAIQDSVAFTKYLLSERGGKEALGAVFAELCGEKNSLTLQRKGISLYYRYTGDCLKIFDRTVFE